MNLFSKKNANIKRMLTQKPKSKKKQKDQEIKEIRNKSSLEQQISTNQHIKPKNQDIVSALYQKNLFEGLLEPHIWSRLDWRDLWSASHVSEKYVAF